MTGWKFFESSRLLVLDVTEILESLLLFYIFFINEISKDYIYAVDSNGNPYSPSWYTLNFRTQYKFGTRLVTSINLENLTNQRYRTYSSGIVAPGTNLVLGIAYNF